MKSFERSNELDTSLYKNIPFYCSDIVTRSVDAVIFCRNGSDSQTFHER